MVDQLEAILKRASRRLIEMSPKPTSGQSRRSLRENVTSGWSVTRPQFRKPIKIEVVFAPIPSNRTAVTIAVSFATRKEISD
jgi:hypothetical protein